MNNNIRSQIISATIPCTDDGKKFICTSRLHLIESTLKDSDFILLKKASLSRIYQHKLLDVELPTVIVSAHIDSVYNSYWTCDTENEISGTLDNSACVGILLNKIINKELNPQTIVVFTGNEEQDGKGAKQVSRFIKKTDWLYDTYLYVISLDLTNDFYGTKHYTIENYNTDVIKEHCMETLPEAGIVTEACPDDSWYYDKQGLACFSLCLPCMNIGEDMHSDKGVSIKSYSLTAYSDALGRLIKV